MGDGRLSPLLEAASPRNNLNQQPPAIGLNGCLKTQIPVAPDLIRPAQWLPSLLGPLVSAAVDGTKQR